MVCTANQYRSPLAEFFMRRPVQEIGLDWVIESAGTRARAGRPLHPDVAQLLSDRSVPLSPWRSRVLTRGVIDQADLILAAEHHHRSEIVTMAPSAVHRTFLLGQFARLTGANAVNGASVASGPALLAAVIVARGRAQPAPEGFDDIVDPSGSPIRALRQCADRIEATVRQIVASPQAAGIPSRLHAD